MHSESESTERLVRTWMASGREQEIDQAVSDISSGRSTLLNVVKALGEYLTSEEDLLRTKGVEYLSSVISRCPPEKINRQSTRVLVTFYSGKLDDTETIIPALKGLVPMTALPTFTSADAVETMNALFTHVKMKAHVQTTRYLVFSVIDSLIAHHRDALKTMGGDFLSGYVSLTDGEKDPRNLLLAFAIDRVVCIEFDITGHIDDLFNITFCYFPITFKPPPDDPYGITPDELKQSLRSCLNATPAFGPLAIPLFLDKLTAGSPVTKRDTLQTISYCLPVYGPGVARKFAHKMWNSFKLEIFQPTDPETESNALEATQTLLQTIYGRDVSGSGSVGEIEGLAKEICEECLEVLREPEKSQAKPAIKVLAAFVGTTPSISRYTLMQAIPYLLKQFRSSDELANRPQILLLLGILVTAAIAGTSVPSDEVKESPLLPYKSELLGAFIMGIKTSNTLAPALHGLKNMSQINDFFTDEDFGFIVHNINEVLQSDSEDIGNAADDVLDVLVAIAGIAPRHIEETTLPLLFISLPDRAPSRDAHAERAKHWRTLQSLTKLCIPPILFETFVVRLSTKLDLICTPLYSTTEGIDVEPSTAYAHSVLKALAKALEIKVDACHSDIPKYIDRLVPRLYNLFIYLALTSDGRSKVGADPRLLEVTAEIITSIVQVVSAEQQSKFAQALCAAYLLGDIKELAKGHQDIPSDVVFQPFERNATVYQRNLIILFSAAVVAFRKGVVVTNREPTEFLSTLTWSLDEDVNDTQRSAALNAVASLLNKHVEAHAPFISEQSDKFWNLEVADTSKPCLRRRAAIQGWIWVVKGLLVRNHDLTMTLAGRLFDLFDDTEVSWDAAKAIGNVSSGGEGILTKRNHAVIRVLYAQRYFNGVIPRIIEGIKGSSRPPRQAAYLVALISLISAIPKATYIQQMPTLMPLLLRGLDLPDITMRANVISTLSAAAENGEQAEVIAEHASSLVSAMLSNSKLQDQTSAALRIAALKYLAILPRIVRYDILHPQKSTVIRELGEILDDPKRTVRKEAVDARTVWFTFNG